MSHKLVESFRADAGPRQRVVMDLGALSLPKPQCRKLAAALEARLAGQVSLFETDPPIAIAAEQAMQNFDFRKLRKEELRVRGADKTWTAVELQSVQTMESRSLGPELVAHTRWQRLQIPEFLTSLGWSRKERSLAEAVVVGRLVAPAVIWRRGRGCVSAPPWWNCWKRTLDKAARTPSTRLRTSCSSTSPNSKRLCAAGRTD